MASEGGSSFTLPWKRFFGAECPTCEEGIACAVSGEQAQVCEQDPVQGLRALPTENQEAIAEFFQKHAALGHRPHPFLADMAPLPRG